MGASDSMLERIRSEIAERESFIDGIVDGAQRENRDLNDSEMEMVTRAKERLTVLNSQVGPIGEAIDIASRSRQRLAEIDARAATSRNPDAAKPPVEYRSAGQWAVDSYRAHLGDSGAQERLEMFHRAADHQTTPDNPGIIPDPIIGTVINFIDAARPIVSFIGPMNLPSATWHRPKVTQHTSVGVQGTDGGPDDEKTELVSQRMLITRLTANAITYGGYVNVSRQNIDFSQPQVMDLIINDLAAQYAIETEAAAAASLAATTTTAVEYPADPSSDDIAAAVWAAVAAAYGAVRGQGRLVLAVAPDRLELFGPLFQPVSPRDAHSEGLTAANFGQGVLGAISGVPVVMSSGLADGEAFLLSTAAFELFEQRVGTLQVTEPSVLGVQVAYAGYFTPLLVESGGVVPIAQGA